MSKLRSAGLVFVLLLAGCARPPEHRLATPPPQQVDTTITTASIRPATLDVYPVKPVKPASANLLEGRTLAVAVRSDIALHPGEVILTFDDGPRPGKTDRVLDILDDYNVKATFLMIGEMVDTYPEMTREVARRGHTVGTHTYDHTNLASVSVPEAEAAIQSGRTAVARALGPIGQSPSPFFRFPYLAQTQFLRTSLALDRAIVLDVDIDSKDYYNSTPEEVLARTLNALEKRGSGIVLFHDIHERTIAMLPGFLDALEVRGYSVVTLRAKSDSIFDTELVTAEIGRRISVRQLPQKARWRQRWRH